MGEQRIVVRILGLASTTRGFGFAVTEGPRRMVTWGLRRTPAQGAGVIKALDEILRRSRPLFVAFDDEAAGKKRRRGRLFKDVVAKACDVHGIMILSIESGRTKALAGVPRPTKRDIGQALILLFPEVANKLPPRRKAWQSEDDRIGMFMALAAAVCAWESFRGTQR